MGELKAGIIAEWISQDAANRDFRPLSEVITTVLTPKLRTWSPETISDIADKLHSHVTAELLLIAEDSRSNGMAPQFVIVTEGKTSHYKALDTPERQLLDSLKARSPKEFENFCGTVLDGLGANGKVVGQVHDGGIDFLGYGLPLGGDKGPAPGNSRALVLGQAKRYTTNRLISEIDLREFVGGAVQKAAELRRTKPDSVGTLSPIVFAYWTTSDFNKTARAFARDMGLWYLNGIGLAQLAGRAGIVLPANSIVSAVPVPAGAPIIG